MQDLEDGYLQTLTINGRTAYSCEVAAGGPVTPKQPIFNGVVTGGLQDVISDNSDNSDNSDTFSSNKKVALFIPGGSGTGGSGSGGSGNSNPCGQCPSNQICDSSGSRPVCVPDPTPSGSGIGSSGYCPYACRELPYPYNQQCTGVVEINNKNQTAAQTRTACSNLPVVCKVIRYVNPKNPYFDNDGIPNTADDYVLDQYSPNYQRPAGVAATSLVVPTCPVQCRTTPPLANNCINSQSASITFNGQTRTYNGQCTAQTFCLFTEKANGVILEMPRLHKTPQASPAQMANNLACVSS